MPDKPWFPYVQCAEDKRLPVLWGKGGWIFILAVCGVLATAGLTAYRVEAGEEAAKATERNVKVLGENQRKLDEAQRIQASQTGLTVKQLNALLQKAGVTEHISAPPVKKSELKELE